MIHTPKDHQEYYYYPFVIPKKPLNDYGSVSAGDFYYGNIYIPITDPVQGFGTTKDQIRSKSEFMHPAKDWEIAQNVRAAEKTSNWEKYNFNN